MRGAVRRERIRGIMGREREMRNYMWGESKKWGIHWKERERIRESMGGDRERKD